LSKKEEKPIEVFIIDQPSWSKLSIPELQRLFDRIKNGEGTLINRKHMALQLSGVINKMEYAEFELSKLVESKSKFSLEHIEDNIASREERDYFFLCRCWLELFTVTLHGSVGAMARVIWLVYELNELKEDKVNITTVTNAMVKNHRGLEISKFLDQTLRSIWCKYLHDLRIQLEHGDNLLLAFRSDDIYLPDEPFNQSKRSIENRYELISWCKQLFDRTIDFHCICSKEVSKFLF